MANVPREDSHASAFDALHDEKYYTMNETKHAKPTNKKKLNMFSLLLLFEFIF